MNKQMNWDSGARSANDWFKGVEPNTMNIGSTQNEYKGQLHLHIWTEIIIKMNIQWVYRQNEGVKLHTKWVILSRRTFYNKKCNWNEHLLKTKYFTINFKRNTIRLIISPIISAFLLISSVVFLITKAIGYRDLKRVGLGTCSN